MPIGRNVLDPLKIFVHRTLQIFRACFNGKRTFFLAARKYFFVPGEFSSFITSDRQISHFSMLCEFDVAFPTFCVSPVLNLSSHFDD